VPAMEITIRDFEEKDLLHLYFIDQICYPPGISYDMEAMFSFLFDPANFGMVAEEEGKIAGFVLAGLKPRGCGHIITLDIHPNFRCRGIGKTLLTKAEERLNSLGAKKVVLEVDVRNMPAISLYRKVGYKVVKRLNRYYLSRYDAYLMEKSLKK